MCITRRKKAPPTVDCTSIEYLGVLDSDYLIPVSEAVKLIESGKDKFYLVDPTLSRIYVSVASKDGKKYVRARDYDTQYDDLLQVSECKVTNREPNERASLLIHGIRDLLDR